MKNFKLFGLNLWQLLFAAFVLLNIKTIMNLFGLITKPIDNAISSIQDAQVKEQLKLSDSETSFSSQLCQKLYDILNPPKKGIFFTDVDEVLLCKTISDSCTTSHYYQIIKDFYNTKYSTDLVVLIKDAVDVWDIDARNYLKKRTFFSELL